MITGACRKCEDWKVKDLLYTIRTTENKLLKSLWFVYGDCYAASQEIYEKASEEIQNIKESRLQIDFTCGKIDMLDITQYSSNQGWVIQNPSKAFNYLSESSSNNFTINSLMTIEKYDSFPETDKFFLENLNNPSLSIKNVKIKSPNNPAKLVDAKLIQFNL